MQTLSTCTGQGIGYQTYPMQQAPRSLSAGPDCGCGCGGRCGGLQQRPRIIFANDPRTRVIYGMEGLGQRRVLADAEANAYVEVLEVTEDDRGTLVRYRTQWYTLLNCHDFLAVWTDADTGDLLGSSRVEVDNSGWFNVATGTCTKEVVTRLNTSADRRVTLQLWQAQGNTVSDVLNGTAIGFATESRPFWLDESEDVGGQPQNGDFSDTIEEGTQAIAGAIFRPLATWAAVGLGLYIAYANRDAIAGAFQ